MDKVQKDTKRDAVKSTKQIKVKCANCGAVLIVGEACASQETFCSERCAYEWIDTNPFTPTSIN